MLDAVTHDLAQLINTLDLETPATPASPLGGRTPRPLNRQYQPSPTTARPFDASRISVNSMRPYSHVRGAGGSLPPSLFLGQRIASWDDMSLVNTPLASVKAPAAAPASPTFTLKHKRTLTPTPLPDASPVLRPLRPAKSRPRLNSGSKQPPPGPPPDAPAPIPGPRDSRRGKVFSRGSIRIASAAPFDELSTNPLFMAAKKRLSPDKQSTLPPSDEDSTSRRPLAPGAKKMLGMRGTMGGSDVSSAYTEDGVDRDPDSDIPGELQVILDGNKRRSIEDTINFGRLSDSLDQGAGTPEDESPPSSPPPPVFRARVIDESDNQADIIEDEELCAHEYDENFTKKSFDFTGEINRLTESGASDSRSFMEQLEKAFKSPAKIDLRYDFGGEVLTVNVPPLSAPLPPSPPASDFERYSVFLPS